MTVTAAEARIEYAGNGTTKVFAYPFQFFQADDLDVWLFEDATGLGVEQVLGADYTVTGELNPTGGSVTFGIAPPAGYTVIIINNPDIVQTLHYVNADDFPADSHEQGLDRLTKICQRLSDRVDRAVRAPDYAPEDQVPDADTLVNLVEEAQEAADASAASAGAAADSAADAAASAATIGGEVAAAAASAAAAATSAADAADAAAAADTSADAAAASAADAQVDKIEWKGNWSSATSYAANDAVNFAGTSYIAKTANMNKQPDTNPAVWDVLAAKGAQGPAGAGTGDMVRANNLSDVVSVSQSRTNLGLGSSATLNVGTGPNTVAAGNDARIDGAVQHTGDTMVGHLGLPVGPGAAQAVRKDYVDTAIAGIDLTVYAPKASPALSGNPTAPTPAPGDNDTSLATTAFVQAALAAAAPILRGYISGLTLGLQTAATPMVGPGVAASSDASAMMQLPSTLVKTQSAWSVGNNGGGLDTGTIAANTWYHVHLIQRPDTGLVDFLFSLSATAPTMPANYTKRRRIGSIRMGTLPNFGIFLQDGDYFYWYSPTLDSAVVPAAPALRTLPVPYGVNVIARCSVQITGPGGAGYYSYHWDPTLGATLPSSGSGLVQITEGLTGTVSVGCQVRIRTSTASQIYNSGVGAISAYNLWTEGWIDTRGRDA